jgi:hypothetical protein
VAPPGDLDEGRLSHCFNFFEVKGTFLQPCPSAKAGRARSREVRAARGALGCLYRDGRSQATSAPRQAATAATAARNSASSALGSWCSSRPLRLASAPRPSRRR